MRVCQICGSGAYPQLLVVCSKCHTISEHTYCLDKLEETDDGEVRWACEFCEPRVYELSSSINNASDTETIESFKKLQDDGAEPLCSLLSAEAETVRDVDTGALTNELSPFYQDLEESHDPTQQMHNIVGELHLADKDSEGTRLKAPNSGSSEPSSILQDDLCSTIEPLPNPVWMGSFQIHGEYCSTVHRMVAHISNVATKEASELVSSLPVLLCLEMVPRINIWPIKFKEIEPTVGNIAVYFFPEDYRAERVYDCLVDDIIERKFAMISTVNNVDLLIFSSCELPVDNWRLQRKYYLWGLFRRKKRALPNTQTDDCPSNRCERIDHTRPSKLSAGQAPRKLS